MNYYLDLSNISHIPNAYKWDSRNILGMSGANIGNFAFRHALNIITDLSTFKAVGYKQLIEQNDREKAELIVASCANWLCASEFYESTNKTRVEALEQTDCPVVAFGIGAQAAKGATSLKLGKYTGRLAHILSERSKSISVRDEFTYDVLNSMGIKNAVVTGCPSNFINLEMGLGKLIAGKARLIQDENPNWSELKSHICEYNLGHKLSPKILELTLKILESSPSFYIIQAVTLFPWLFKEVEKIPEEYLNKGLYNRDNEVQMEKFLRSKVLHFSSIEGWLDFSRTADIAFGMRIHGNMIPLQSGVPSIVINHDSRTEGLCNFMGIPTVTPEEFVNGCDAGPSFLMEKVATAMEGYDLNRSRLAKIFKTHILDNGMQLSQQFSRFG